MQHQNKNTECGIYSISFILRLLNGETFDDINNNRVDDDNVHDFEELSRPVLPDFKTAQEAIKFILEVPLVAQFGGYDLDNMSDEELIDFANRVAAMIQIMKQNQSQ